jgi:hypothetical protein
MRLKLSSARTSRWQKVLIGSGLVALLWVLFAFIAFVVFDRDTPALLIVTITLGVFIAVVVTLAWKRIVDLETGGYSVISLALLVALYMVPLRDTLPVEARELNAEISARHEDRYEYARELFGDITSRFTGPTREYMLQPLRIFLIKSPSYFWETRGYMPSHLQAQVYRHMLLDSGRFAEGDVQYRTGRCFNSPHGYVVIQHPDRPIYADLWAATHIDEYRFGQVVDMPSCDRITEGGGPEGQPY